MGSDFPIFCIAEGHEGACAALEMPLGSWCDLKFQIKRAENGQKRFDPCGRVATFDQRNRFLPQPSPMAKLSLAEGVFLSGAAYNIPNLPGITGKVVHVTIMCHKR
jgi:hypothetical protein